MEGLVGLSAAVAVGSLVITKAIDFLRNLLDKQDTYPKWIWNVGAFVLGVGYAWGWHQNLSQDLAALVPALNGIVIPGWAGELLTGLLFGGAAGGWHEVLSALSSIQNRNDAQAGVRVTTKTGVINATPPPL